MAPAPIQSKLRNATAHSHAAVDQEFSRYDLADMSSYGEFLRAHARALGGLEKRLIEDRDALPVWSPRMRFLEADLQALGLPVPTPLPLAGDFSSAMMHGVLYVVEGSRLGSVVLSRRVAPDFPSTFLHAAHAQGEWQALLSVLDGAATDNSEQWFEEAVTGARRTFDHYTRGSSTTASAA
jgi:heme oxygenase